MLCSGSSSADIAKSHDRVLGTSGSYFAGIWRFLWSPTVALIYVEIAGTSLRLCAFALRGMPGREKYKDAQNYPLRHLLKNHRSNQNQDV